MVALWLDDQRQIAAPLFGCPDSPLGSCQGLAMTHGFILGYTPYERMETFGQNPCKVRRPCKNREFLERPVSAPYLIRINWDGVATVPYTVKDPPPQSPSLRPNTAGGGKSPIFTSNRTGSLTVMATRINSRIDPPDRCFTRIYG